MKNYCIPTPNNIACIVFLRTDILVLLATGNGAGNGSGYVVCAFTVKLPGPPIFNSPI